MGSFATWIQGAIHATLSGAANALGGIVIDPAKFNIQTREGWRYVALLSAWGALIGLVGYLRESPLAAKQNG